jgi:hypothetical protein
LWGTAVTHRGTILDEFIRVYFNIDADPIGVPIETMLILRSREERMWTKMAQRALAPADE